MTAFYGVTRERPSFGYYKALQDQADLGYETLMVPRSPTKVVPGTAMVASVDDQGQAPPICRVFQKREGGRRSTAGVRHRSNLSIGLRS